MWTVVQVFENHQGFKPFHGRDDLALLAVARTLHGLLSDVIPNSVVSLDQNWDGNDRRAYVDAAANIRS